MTAATALIEQDDLPGDGKASFLDFFLLFVAAAMLLGIKGPISEGAPFEYVCGFCDFSDVADTGAQTYIRAVVNEDVDQWEPGDQFVIEDVDGDELTFQYMANGNFIVVDETVGWWSGFWSWAWGSCLGTLAECMGSGAGGNNPIPR